MLALNSAGVASDSTIYGAAAIDRRTADAYERLLANLFVLDVVPMWLTNRLSRLVKHRSGTSSQASVSNTASAPSRRSLVELESCGAAREDLQRAVSAVFTTPLWTSVDFPSPTSVADVVAQYDSNEVVRGVISDVEPVTKAPLGLIDDEARVGNSAMWSGYRVAVTGATAENSVFVALAAGGPDVVEAFTDMPDLLALIGACAGVVVGNPDASPLDKNSSAIIAVGSGWREAPVPWGSHPALAIWKLATLDDVAREAGAEGL